MQTSTGMLRQDTMNATLIELARVLKVASHFCLSCRKERENGGMPELFCTILSFCEGPLAIPIPNWIRSWRMTDHVVHVMFSVTLLSSHASPCQVLNFSFYTPRCSPLEIIAHNTQVTSIISDVMWGSYLFSTVTVTFLLSFPSRLYAPLLSGISCISYMSY